MDTNFRIGATVENIDNNSERYGEQATVTRFGADGIQVRYEDGHVGKAITASKYYRIVSNAPTENVGATTCKPMDTVKNAIRAVKRSLMNSNEKALIDSGLKDECGNYTSTAIAILAQSAAQADVELGSTSVLISAANAIMEEREAAEAKK